MHDKTNVRTFTDTFMPINKFTSNTMTKKNEKTTDHIILPRLTMMAGWRIPANDSRRIRLQPDGH